MTPARYNEPKWKCKFCKEKFIQKENCKRHIYLEHTDKIMERINNVTIGDTQ